MCGLPSYLLPTHDIRAAWAGAQEANVQAEGAAFVSAYCRDARGIYSIIHQHWHPNGEPLPIVLDKKSQKTCRGQQKGAIKHTPKCKAGFPKTALMSKVVRVVCPGLARRLDLRVRGRRNALGSILGRRSDAFLSGTTPSFAVIFRSCVNRFSGGR